MIFDRWTLMLLIFVQLARLLSLAPVLAALLTLAAGIRIFVTSPPAALASCIRGHRAI